MGNTYRLGKTPARPGSVSLKFSDVFHAAALPTPPAVFGHELLMPGSNWHMLGNDQIGDCVFAGAAHEHMLWTLESGEPRARFTTRDVTSDYSAVTGYNPADPSTDQGTDMQVAASYRRKTGVIDATGTRHKIDAYVALDPGNVSQLALAAWLFGAVGVGLNVPSTMENQFSEAQPWDVVHGAKLVGGHYVPVVGRNSKGNFVAITWGALQAMTPEFYQTFNDETIAYLSLEFLQTSTKLSPEGFDQAGLESFLGRLTV